MALCRDNATNYLAQMGYSVVRIPRENIAPLDLAGRDRDQIKLGTLTQLLKSPGGRLPPVKTDQDAANVSGQTSSKMKLAIGINLLGNVLRALAGTQLGIDAVYQKAKTIQFEFTDVFVDSVEPLALGEYLRDAEINAGNPVLDRYILGKGQLFVITEILKSASITVKAERSGGGNLSLDVPVIQQIASGNLQLDASRASNGLVKYIGSTKLTFGFKAFRIGIEDGDLKLSSAAPNEIALAAGLGAPEYALGSGGLLEIDEGGLL